MFEGAVAHFISYVLSVCIGTEAAAAGIVTMQRVGCGLGAKKPSPIEFKADRPFLFFIREMQRDIILFSGKLVSPTASN
jgi:serpin B